MPGLVAIAAAASCGGVLDFPIRMTRVTMTLSPDGKTATKGTISGVMSTEELVTSFEEMAGAISTQLYCNAISIGIGFDAAAVAVGPVAGPVAPARAPCLP